MNNFKHPIVIISAAFALIIVGIGFWYISKPTQSDASFSPAHMQALTEEVSVNGPVTSAAAVDLAFEHSGKIARVGAQVGDTVQSGAALVSLDNADLAAQLAGAKATLASQEAMLAELQKGSRPEDITLAETQVSNAQAALNDTYRSMTDKIQDAYTKSNQAIHNTADNFFSNPKSSNPKISFITTDSQIEIDLGNERPAMESILTSWRLSLNEGSATSIDAKKNLGQLRDFFVKAATALADAVSGNGVTQDTIESWKAGVAAAQTSLNTAYAAITAGEDATNNAESALKAAQDQLALRQAGSTPEQIAAQQAAVNGAAAAVDGAAAQLVKTIIRAPISGVVTRQDARAGAIASPNVPLVSMISSAAFQIEALVSEADVAKIHTGDTVSVTLDTYGNDVSFPAMVTSVDPSATVNQGVSSYRVVIQFKEKDERIKTGMTANAQIITAQKENALAIPWNSVIARGDTSFVLVKNPNGQNAEREIKTGIRSGDLIEIISGLKDGELVASYGTNK